jgi:Domain of Unknown Function (DUF1080)
MHSCKNTLGHLILSLWIVGVTAWCKSPATRLTTGQLTSEELEAGWISLFDGESLFGWKAESKVDWTVVDGAIRGTKGEVGLLRTTTQFDRFEFQVEFTAEESTNSGVFFHTSPQPKNPTVDCYEFNIINPDRHEFATGALVGRVQSQYSPHLKRGEWHVANVTVDSGRIRVQIDGKDCCSWEDSKPLGKGFIGLQFNSGTVMFRNIKLRPLSLQSVGDQPETWDRQLLKDARVEWTAEGKLQLQGGPGQLETKAHFDDFVLSTKAKTNGIINSGIFFRAIPGELMNGYECQIDHQMIDNDPLKPKDFGTGGIFRRQNARAVLTRENEWFHLTLIANGNHFATWVNGRQVADWRDERAADKNPRKGARTEAGSIILQAHDSMTDIEFAAIDVREIDRRNR